jgi:hypothetical protein
MLSQKSKNHTQKHWFQMYFDQFVFILYMRATLFNFSDTLSRISRGLIKPPANNEEWRTCFLSLRRKFTFFENLYQFPLLSNQQQGLEMYQLCRRHMDIDELYREVSTEVHGSDSLVEGQLAEDRSSAAKLLNKLGALGLIFSIILAGLGCLLGTLQVFLGECEKSRMAALVIGSVVVILTSIFCVHLQNVSCSADQIGRKTRPDSNGKPKS